MSAMHPSRPQRVASGRCPRLRLGEKLPIIGWVEGTGLVGARFGSLVAFEIALTLCWYSWLAVLSLPAAES